MAIQAQCVNGHAFKVKDKYAGKRGYCPYCQAAVFVPGGGAFSEQSVLDLIGPPELPPPPETHHESVLDEGPPPEKSSPSQAISLLGSSFMKDKRICPKCHAKLPLWYGSCPNCKKHFTDDVHLP